MNIIFVGKFRGKPLRCQLDGPRQLVFCSLIISLFAGLLVSSGYWYGAMNTASNELVALENDISQQKVLIMMHAARLNLVWMPWLHALVKCRPTLFA